MVLENVPPVLGQRGRQYRPLQRLQAHRLRHLASGQTGNDPGPAPQQYPQLFSIAKPGAPLTLLTDYAEPVRGARYQPRLGKYYVFNKDVGGNEVFRSYRRDSLSSAEAVPITPDGQRVQGTSLSEKSGRMVYVTVPVNRQGSADQIVSTVSLVDPLKPESAQAGRAARRRLVRFPFLARRQAAGVHRIRVGQ
ncbi:hypothetical protein LP420_15170 [Massilia sp. B-10]|nr:hypothetical protein LP420_15170 [Massilia sp. B-10]